MIEPVPCLHCPVVAQFANDQGAEKVPCDLISPPYLIEARMRGREQCAKQGSRGLQAARWHSCQSLRHLAFEYSRQLLVGLNHQSGLVKRPSRPFAGALSVGG